MPAHALADYRISWHSRRYRVLPDRGVSSYPERVRDQSTHDTWQYRALQTLVKERKAIVHPTEDDVGKFINYEGVC